MKKVHNIKIRVNIKTRILVFIGFLVFYLVLTSVSVNATTSISLVKSASPTTYSTLGNTITYTYKVNNTGTTTISGNFKVYDNITGITTITSTSLSSGKNVTGTANYAITQINLDAGSVTNSAYAKSNGNTTTSNTVNATITAIQNPSLNITKSASPTTYSAVGQNITYTYKVTNIGNVDILGNITVADNKTGTFNITSSGLNVGKNITGTANYTIKQSDIDAGSVINLANATCSFNNALYNSNNITARVNSTQTPVLNITKSASPISYNAVGQNITYTYTVTNTGNVDILGNITVADNKTGTFNITSSGLNLGNNVTETAKYAITQSDLDNGYVINLANATCSFNNALYTSNNTTATSTAVQNPALTLVKLASPTSYNSIGQNIIYHYTITNSGNVDLTGNITVADNKTGTFNITNSGINVVNSITGTAKYAITQSDLDAGYVTNSAYATNNNTISNTVTATSGAYQSQALNITEVASPTSYNTVGQNITYTYTVTNSGSVNLTGNITVVDNKTGTFNITSSGLNLGNNITGTANYTIKQSDLNAGYVTNSAYTTNNNTISNTVTETSIAVPLLMLKPTIPINCYAGGLIPGQNAEFVVNVTNTGGAGYLNVSLDNFTDAAGTGIFTQKGSDKTINTQNDITNITTIGIWIDTSAGGSHTSPQSGDYVLNYNNSTATATKVLNPTAVGSFLVNYINPNGIFWNNNQIQIASNVYYNIHYIFGIAANAVNGIQGELGVLGTSLTSHI